jgi:purine nucleosidase
MGGGFFEGGNITPAAEFNIFVDPEAAEIVLHCGRPVTVIPLDCTHKALITPPRLRAIADLGTRVGQVVTGWLDFFDASTWRNTAPRAARYTIPA